MSNLTPKEKAYELVNNIMAVNLPNPIFGLNTIESKKFAIICVNEILNDILLSKYYARYRFWEQVKKEIELL